METAQAVYSYVRFRMERIRDIQKAKTKVLDDMNAFISGIRVFSKNKISDLAEGLSALTRIRASVYENLIQIQHEYLFYKVLEEP